MYKNNQKICKSQDKKLKREIKKLKKTQDMQRTNKKRTGKFRE
jgi:ABC-type Na+ transport system ATPase subunit NatA